MLFAAIAIVVVIVIAISIAEVLKIRRKSSSELAALLQTDQWARYNAAIKELKRRGESVAAFEPRLLSLLISDSLIQRGNAFNVISDHYPQLKAKLQGYLSTDRPELSREKFRGIFGEEPAMNVSYDQGPVDLDLVSRFIVMADPLALEGLRALELPDGSDPTAGAIAEALIKAPAGFAVYLHEIPAFSRGRYRIVFSDIVATTEENTVLSATVDSGALVFFDFSKHHEVLEHLTWDAYDLALQDGSGRRFEEIAARIGSRSCGIMFGNADAKGDFHGDGAYVLKPSAPVKLPK